jgi:hypothetical protein
VSLICGAELESEKSGVCLTHSYGRYGHDLASWGITGAGNRVRTRDPLITNQVLYQLSYTGTQAAN